MKVNSTFVGKQRIIKPEILKGVLVMETDVQKEATSAWINKEPLEKALAVGMHGVPELKHAEKTQFLGEFRERVIKMLTKKQVMEPGIYPEIADALRDKRAYKLIINGELPIGSTEKYAKLALTLGKNYTVIHDPEFKGVAGLVVVGHEAVDAEDITVQDRLEKLRELGVPLEIINAAGKKVCSKCKSKIIEVAPYESINYSDLTPSERFWGEHCAACVVH